MIFIKTVEEIIVNIQVTPCFKQCNTLVRYKSCFLGHPIGN